MQIQTNQKRKELKSHGSFEFPVRISRENLSSYEDGAFFWHWHPEIELTLILEGSIEYQVDQTLYQLHAGEGLFCNTNMLHTGKMHDDHDCLYISVTFDPKIIYGYETSLLQRKYVLPITENAHLPSIRLTPDTPWQHDVLHDLQTLWKFYQQSPDTLEMQIQQLLSHIWLLIYTNNAAQSSTPLPLVRDRERLRQMLLYIHEHYQEKMTLDDMAASVNICKSECCRFFKKHMNTSIFDYLLHYRIKKSLDLLQNTNESITDISLKTGFLNPCYFSKIFKQELGCTPREYRNRKHPALSQHSE